MPPHLVTWRAWNRRETGGNDMKRVHIAIHDVSPVHEETLREAVSILGGMGIDRYSMFVIPDYRGRCSLRDHPRFCLWLKGLMAQGAEMVLHGYRHCGPDRGLGPLDTVRNAVFTRGEGEFLGMTGEDALKLLRAGTEIMEDCLAWRSEGFVAPAWLYSRGTRTALSRLGFKAAESRWRVWNPSSGATLLKVPVANYAGGGAFKRSLASFWVAVYPLMFGAGSTLRFAMHPDDFQDEHRRRGVIRFLGRVSSGRTPVTLRQLATAP